MIYLWACVVVLLIIYFYIYYTDPRRVIDKMFPGPIRFPFFGNALQGIRSTEGAFKMYIEYPKYFQYKTFRVWLLHHPYIIVTDYKVAKMILSSQKFLDKADEYKYFEPWLGKAIFTATGEKWKKSRRLVTPAFHFKILHQFIKIFCTNADTFCQKLKEHDGKGVFDVYEYVAMFALDNICDTAMGVNVEAQNNPESKYVHAVKSMATVLYERCLFLWLRADWIFNLSSTARLQEKCLKILHGYTDKVIQIRKQKLKQKTIREIRDQDSDAKQKMAFLDTLLERAQDLGFTDEEIRQEVDTIMFAGHDTISSALSFVFYALAEHQQVQEKVFEELEKIFQKSNRQPTFDDLQEMKYMEQTIKETLRYYTIVPLIARRLHEDYQINDEQYIPKNVDVVVVIGAIHRDPAVWPNPELFDPDRFSPETSQNRDSFAFLPFSAGPRNCLGQKYAMFEMKITLCQVLRKFRLYLSDNPRDKMRLKAGIVITSANGVRIKLKSR